MRKVLIYACFFMLFISLCLTCYTFFVREYIMFFQNFVYSVAYAFLLYTNIEHYEKDF